MELFPFFVPAVSLQCFDTVGSAAGRASGLWKIWGHCGGGHWLVRMELRQPGGQCVCLC